MRPTKYIFHFETCESYSVDPKRVDRLLIDGIGKCLRFTPNWHAKRWLCSALTLDLPLDVELKSELGYLPALYATPERLMDGDLTAVEVEWQMCRWLPFKLVRRFYVPWYPLNEEGDRNAYHHAEKHEKGYHIRIAPDNKGR